jgi:uncharacterized protein Smg (DUF494 family)
VTYDNYQLLLLAGYSAGRGLTAVQLNMLGLASNNDSLLASFQSAAGGAQYVEKIRVLTNLSQDCENFIPVIKKGEKLDSENEEIVLNQMKAVEAKEEDFENAKNKLAYSFVFMFAPENQSKKISPGKTLSIVIQNMNISSV